MLTDDNDQTQIVNGRSFWQYQHFFHHLFLHILISLVLVLGTIVWLFYSASLWEGALFPGMRKIDPIQRDLVIVQAKVEQIQQSIQQLHDKGADIETLKGQISSLQQAVLALEKEKPSNPSSFEPGIVEKSPLSADLKEHWQKAKICLQTGEPCTETLTDFKSKLPNNPLLQESLNKVFSSAHRSVKTLELLQGDLEKIYQTFKDSAAGQEVVTVAQPVSWGQALWRYFSTWIQVRRLDTPSATEQVSVVALLEQALNALKKGSLQAAIDHLQALNHLDSIKLWLAEAHLRQQRDQAAEEFGKIFNLSLREEKPL